MIHNGECNIDLAAGLDMKPTKVVQGVVNVDLKFFQSAGATSAPAQLIIKGEHAAEVWSLLGLMKGPDDELAADLRKGLSSEADGKTDEECAKAVRQMAFERLMELREDK